MILSSLTKNILSTLVYYDSMNYPMTSFEIWKYLISFDFENKSENCQKFSLFQIVEELEKNEIREKIEEKQGYYFLKGRERLVNERIQKNKIAKIKIEIVRSTVFWLRFVPFLKSIVISGGVAMKNVNEESDIDFIVFFKKGKIFTGRFFITLIIQILGRRRYDDKIKNRICLNHFLSDEHAVAIKDLYSTHVYCFLIPIYNANVLKDFQNKNGWIKKYRPNFEFEASDLKDFEDSYFSKKTRKFLEIIFCFQKIEEILKKWQMKKIKNNPKTKNSGGIIICNDEELSFWPNFQQQGPKFFEKFKEKVSFLNLELD